MAWSVAVFHSAAMAESGLQAARSFARDIYGFLGDHQRGGIDQLGASICSHPVNLHVQSARSGFCVAFEVQIALSLVIAVLGNACKYSNTFLEHV